MSFCSDGFSNSAKPVCVLRASPIDRPHSSSNAPTGSQVGTRPCRARRDCRLWRLTIHGWSQTPAQPLLGSRKVGISGVTGEGDVSCRDGWTSSRGRDHGRAAVLLLSRATRPRAALSGRHTDSCDRSRNTHVGSPSHRVRHTGRPGLVLKNWRSPGSTPESQPGTTPSAARTRDDFQVMGSARRGSCIARVSESQPRSNPRAWSSSNA